MPIFKEILSRCFSDIVFARMGQTTQNLNASSTGAHRYDPCHPVWVTVEEINSKPEQFTVGFCVFRVVKNMICLNTIKVITFTWPFGLNEVCVSRNLNKGRNYNNVANKPVWHLTASHVNAIKAQISLHANRNNVFFSDQSVFPSSNERVSTVRGPVCKSLL